MDIARVLQTTVEIALAPAAAPASVWTAAPLAAAALLSAFCFRKGGEAAQRWNSAAVNAVVLAFTSIDLLRQIFVFSGLATLAAYTTEPFKTFVALLLLAYSALLFSASFFNAIPRLRFFILATPFANALAYAAIGLVYLKFSVGWTVASSTLAAAALLSAILYGLQQAFSLVFQPPKPKKLREEPLEEVHVPKEEAQEPAPQPQEPPKA